MAGISASQRTKRTSQYADNLSFDETYQVNAVELLGYDDGGAALQRVAVDANGRIETVIISGGTSGTEYADGAARGTATGTLAMGDDGTNIQSVHVDTSGDIQVDVLTSGLPTGAATSALQTTGNTSLATLAGAVAGTEVQVDVLTMPTVTVNSHAVTNAGTFVVQENGAALTALQLIDDTVATLGTTTYTEASTKGLVIGAVRRDADTSLVDTTNEVGPVQMNALGQLKVEVFSGEALPVTLTSTTITGTVTVDGSGVTQPVSNAGLTELAAAINVSSQMDVNIAASGATVPVSGTFWQATQPVSLASTTVTGTVAVTQSGTWDEVGINDSGNSITIDNAQLSVVGTGTEATALRVTIATDSTGVLSVDDNGGSITVDGTFWQATQPVSGTVTANLSATDNAVLDSIDTSTASKYITGIGHGVTTVTTAGTDVALAGSTACKRVVIQAQLDNTSTIAVGATGVDATVATGTGIVLYPGDSFELDIDNLADVFIDSLVNGEGVRYTYFT